MGWINIVEAVLTVHTNHVCTCAHAHRVCTCAHMRMCGAVHVWVCGCVLVCASLCTHACVHKKYAQRMRRVAACSLCCSRKADAKGMHAI